MSDKSGIEWTEATWNPATGCTKVSPGCKFCYAKHKAWPRLSANPKGVYTGRKFEDVQVHPERLDQPIRWKRPRMIFVNSMSDLFHEDIPYAFIDSVFAVIGLARQHVFQILTKRPERMLDYMQSSELSHRLNDAARVVAQNNSIAIVPTQAHGMVPDRWPFPNAWLGVSVENQATADERIPLLLETPAAVRWLSCEPLLDSIKIDHIENHGDIHDRATRGSWWAPLTGAYTDSPTIHWVVVGGESGKGARPMHPSWAMNLRTQCRHAEVPFFMKQGSQANWPDYHNIESFPSYLQVREYPDQTEEL